MLTFKNVKIFVRFLIDCPEKYVGVFKSTEGKAELSTRHIFVDSDEPNIVFCFVKNQSFDIDNIEENAIL